MTDSQFVSPVYILTRVAVEVFAQCQQAAPEETLGKLLGYRCEWQGQNYVKIVDWVSGSLDCAATYACFTPNGVRECEIFVDERYGAADNRPVEVGLFHSHPFGSDPHFSATDYHTFLTFPYDQAGNVFALIDPLSRYFKVYVIEATECGKNLKQVPWVYYTPK